MVPPRREKTCKPMMKRRFGEKRGTEIGRYTVLVTHPNVPENAINLLRQRYNLRVMKSENPTHREILFSAKNVDAMFIYGEPCKVDGAFLDEVGQKLRVISVMGAAADRIDVPALQERNVKVGVAGLALHNCVAEVAIGLALSVAHRMKEAECHVYEGEAVSNCPNWMLGQQIYGSTVGIVGLMGIGTAVAHRISAFQPNRILYTADKIKPSVQKIRAERVELEQLLKESDFVILCCPLTDQNKYLIDKTSLEIMKRNAILVNVGRGPLVDLDDLYDALNKKLIFGAGLDVAGQTTICDEVLPAHHRLLTLSNCVVTPNIGSATSRTRKEMAKLTAENIIAALSNRPMPAELLPPPLIKYKIAY